MAWKTIALCLIGAILWDFHSSAEEIAETPSINQLTTALDGLKMDTKKLFTELGQINTRSQVGSGLVKKIRDEVAPRIQLVNEQQSAITDSFKQQVADLLHRANKAFGVIQEAGSQAEKAKPRINMLKNGVAGIEKDDTQQDTLADTIGTKLDQAKTKFLADAGTVFSHLDTNLEVLSSDLTSLETFNNGKTCEYGTSCISPGISVPMTFDTEFREAPEVCASVIGWSAHTPDLGQGGRHGGGGATSTAIRFRATADNVSRNNFSLSLSGDPDVEILKDVYVRWMACNNLDEKALEPIITTTPPPTTTKESTTTEETTVAAENVSCASQPNYTLYNNSCLRVYSEEVNYTEAESRCQADGAQLFVIVNDTLDLQILKEAALDARKDPDSNGLWVGADALEVQGMFQWNDDRPLPSTSPLWSLPSDIVDFPDSRCVASIPRVDFRLVNNNCGFLSCFICQFQI